MKTLTQHTLVALAAFTVATTPALAGGKNEQATAAIAAAQAKIDAANKVGASGEVPRLQADAQAALREAQNDLSHGHKDEAILAANHAAQLADTAIGEAQKAQSERAAMAQGAAANAAMNAQQDAAAANARAEAAQQAANAAAQDAAAARAAPPVVMVAPAPAPATSTTVTTETSAPAPAAAPKKIVHRAVKHRTQRATTAAVRVKTTTTVSH